MAAKRPLFLLSPQQVNQLFAVNAWLSTEPNEQKIEMNAQATRSKPGPDEEKTGNSNGPLDKETTYQ